MNNTTDFTPDWVVPPCESIKELIEENSWSQTEFASRMGYSTKHTSQLLNGKIKLTQETASKLANVLGSTQDFWLNLEANYQKHKARLKKIEENKEHAEWLKAIPVKELIKIGKINKIRNKKGNEHLIVEECLKFFKVASPNEWNSKYGELQANFRKANAMNNDPGATSVWLRLGEQYAEEISNIPTYNKNKFLKALRYIRTLTRERPEKFKPEMQKALHESGVILAFIPSIPNARISGVVRWLSSHSPLIQLSYHGKKNDKFWFTFFHEAAHILLHADDKNSIFVDATNPINQDDNKEKEADAWARNMLIPDRDIPILKTLKNQESVIEFAKEINIHPGIVVGRLQHDKIISYSWMNDLKENVIT